MNARGHAHAGSALRGGFSLIEVVAALAILSVTLVTTVGLFLGASGRANDLAKELAGDRGLDASRVAAAPEGRDGVSPVVSAWEWCAASPEDAVWRDDGLHVTVRIPDDPVALELGWWVDGWFGGVRCVVEDGNGEVTVQEVRDAPAGAEVVVRVRAGGGAWGTPWRAVKREDAGLTAGPGVEVEGGGRAAADPVLIVVHSAAAGTSVVSLSPPGSLPPDTGEWPAVVGAEHGEVEVECDGRIQALQAGTCGSLHLYY